MTQTSTRTTTFTITDARKLASKVEADLYLCSQYYGEPSAAQIHKYAEELAQLLKDGYVRQYEFGFKKDDQRIVCFRYTVATNGILQSDDRPGRLFSAADVAGATYYNFLTHSSAWHHLASTERERIERSLPVTRTPGTLPSDGNGYWVSGDKTYSSSSVGLGRSTFRPN